MNAVLLARFIFELSGAPVGVVELSLDADTYLYRSTLAYRHTAATREDRFPTDASPMPEGLWFLNRPAAKGCVDGIAELSHRAGKLCATEVGEHEVKGTTFGNAFVARYDAVGTLSELSVGKSHFVRTQAPLHPGQPYAAGFELGGKGSRLALEPAAPGARWPEREPRGLRETPAEDGACLDLAQQFAAENGGRVVLGLVVTEGRAFPHAWVQTSRGEVDPSAETAGAARTNRSYLELPHDRAGALYVELLEGRRSLVWK